MICQQIQVFHTALYGFIEGSKTFPPPYGTSQPKKEKHI
jgi:hypothetical protein